MCRGNRGAKVFGDERDRNIYLDTLGEAIERTGWHVHAWVLMSTHYHLLVETPEPNLVDGMKWFQGTFTQRHNSSHGNWGHLFQGRYKAKVIDDDDPSYFRRAANYIHLNPAAAGLLDRRETDLAQYAWSSYPEYLKPPSKRISWLYVDRVLLCHKIVADTAKGRKAFEAAMNLNVLWVLENRHKNSWKKEWRQHERGWVHGSQECRDRMIALLQEGGGGPVKRIYDGEQRRSYLKAAAEAYLDKGLRIMQLNPSELARMKKGDARKLLLAGWLKAHFTVSNEWLSATLSMGHPTRVSLAHRFYRDPPKEWNSRRAKLEKLITFTG